MKRTDKFAEFILFVLIFAVIIFFGYAIAKVEKRLACVEAGHPCPVSAVRKAA